VRACVYTRIKEGVRQLRHLRRAMQLAPSAPRVAARAPASAAAPTAAAPAAAAAPLRASRGAFAGARVPCTPSGARGGAAHAGGRSCGGARTVAAIKKCSKRSVVKAAVLHAEEGQADAVRALCLAHMNAVNTAKARRGAHNTLGCHTRFFRAQPPYLTAANPTRSHFSAAFSLRRTRPQARNKALGIATFDVHEDPFEPGTFHFWERYDTTAAMATFSSGETQQAFETKARSGTPAWACVGACVCGVAAGGGSGLGASGRGRGRAAGAERGR
jgi:quinol monooxygenase YgiN